MSSSFDHSGDGADYLALLAPFMDSCGPLNSRRKAETIASLKPEDRVRVRKGKPPMRQLNLRIPEPDWLLARHVASEMGVSQPVMIVAAIKALSKINKRKTKQEDD